MADAGLAAEMLGWPGRCGGAAPTWTPRQAGARAC